MFISQLSRCLLGTFFVLILHGCGSGPCNYPDDRARDGSRCGDRAASVRPGGRNPDTDWIKYLVLGAIAISAFSAMSGSSSTRPSSSKSHKIHTENKLKTSSKDSSTELKNPSTDLKSSQNNFSSADAIKAKVSDSKDLADDEHEKKSLEITVPSYGAYDKAAQNTKKGFKQTDAFARSLKEKKQPTQKDLVIELLADEFDHSVEPAMTVLLDNSIEFGNENGGTELDMAVDYMLSLISYERQKGNSGDLKFVQETANKILSVVDLLSLNAELVESQANDLKSSIDAGNSQVIESND